MKPRRVCSLSAGSFRAGTLVAAIAHGARFRRAAAVLLCLGCASACSKPPRGVQTQPASEATATPDSRRTHLVAPGDTWQSIAETYFGTPAPAERLASENGGQAAEPPTPGEQVTVSIPAADLPGVRRLAEAREPYNQGVQLLEQERPREAAEAFEEALRRAPDFVDARYNLGLALLQMDRSRDAVAPLRAVAAARPADKDAHYALASAYFHQQLYREALAALDAALALDARFLRARFTRAMTLERLGDAPQARAAWQQYLELDAASAWAQEARQHLNELD